MLFIFISNSAMATCDFSTGITEGPNKTFIYSEACHQKVGQLVQEAKTKDAQLSDLAQAVLLKDLALTKSDARVSMWTETAEKEQDRMSTLLKDQSRNGWLIFALGVATTLGAGFMASRLIQR